MSHPFEEGKTYRNRIGEYEVQSIEGEKMKIRYTDGKTLMTSVGIQARIWENIQFEKQLARAEERQQQAREARLAARQRTARARKARATPTFEGFQKSDFEVKQRGIAWSSRKELGRVLAHQLTQRADGSFGHWIVPRKSAVHVARADQYSTDSRETNASFFVSVDENGVSYGFRVGKPGGKAKSEWPWSVLVAKLSRAKSARQALHAALSAHDLHLDVYAMEVSYGQVGRVTAQDDGFLWHHEDDGQEVSREMSGKELVKYVKTVAPDKRGELFVRAGFAPKEALKKGAGIAAEMVSVLEALVPLYEASIGG